MIRVALMISSMRGGGSEQQTLNLAKHLDRKRFQVSLWLGQREGPLLGDLPADVTVHDFAADPTWFYWPGRAFSRAVDNVRRLAETQRTDVVYDRTFGMTLIASAALDKVGVPRVSTIVSPPDRAVPLVEKRFVQRKRRRLRRAYQDSATVITVSDEAAVSAARYYDLPRRLFVTAANPVDVDSIRRLAQTNALPPGHRRRDVVVVGRMTKEKGHADFLNAVALLPPAERTMRRFRLIGDGPLRTSLEMLATSLSINDCVDFVGHLSNPYVEIASSALLVLPSHFEGLPNVVLEAMALGVPVVATRAGGAAELSPDPSNPTMILTEVGVSAALANAMLRVLGDLVLADKLVASASQNISKNHSLHRNVETISALLVKAAENRPGSGGSNGGL